MVVILTLVACDGDAPVPPPPSPPAAAPVGEAVRLLTFNTALFSPIFQCAGPVDIEDVNPSPLPITPGCHLFNPLGEFIEERANFIADRIDPALWDIVVLNEVWDEDDGKDVLVDRLSPHFPHWVKYVDILGGAFGGTGEDSGLMVFSKFPFEALPDLHFQGEDTESSLGDDSDRIAFVGFDDCEITDCMAAKGALLVRVRHPVSERLLNVVATHMQSGAEHQAARGWQMRQIRGQCETLIATTRKNLIYETLAPTGDHLCDWSNNQWLALMGDLNVQGQGGVGEALLPAQSPTTSPIQWWTQFGGPADRSDSTGYALYDAWAETTSELDRGITLGEQQRLDYVVVSRRTRGSRLSPASARELCVQHIRIPPRFEGLSDHRPVAADLNLGSPQCNPRLAVTPTPDDMGELGITGGKEARKLHKRLRHPASMQWWRLEEDGTYAIALDSTSAALGVTFAIYRADDLGRPLAGTSELGVDTIQACDYDESEDVLRGRCEPVVAQKMVLPAGPFYVRVFSENRAWTGDYWIAVHRYTCKSPAEACELLPNAPQRFAFPPAGTPLDSADAAWFSLSVREQADSGERQSLRFYAEETGSAGWQTPELAILDASATTELAQIDGQPIAPPAPVASPTGAAMLLRDASTAANDAFYLRVRRRNVDADLVLLVGWRTNLTLLGGSAVGPLPAKLVCEDETNPESGADDIDLDINVDGMGWQTRGHAEFDCNDKPHFRNWDSEIGVIRYLESAQVRPVEVDDVSADDVGPTFTPDAWPAATNVATTPSRHILDFKWDGGHYIFHFNLGKWLVQ